MLKTNTKTSVATPIGILNYRYTQHTNAVIENRIGKQREIHSISFHFISMSIHYVTEWVLHTEHTDLIE